jgi:hypothetical protein
MSDQSADQFPSFIAASIYEYSRPERNPVAWIVAGLIAIFATYGAIIGATATFWICLTLFAVVNLWVVWGKTTHGIRLDDQTLTVSPARDPMVISLYLIHSIRYVDDRNRKLVEITCRSGRVQKLDIVHFPRPQTLAALLDAHDISVIAD